MIGKVEVETINEETIKGVCFENKRHLRWKEKDRFTFCGRPTIEFVWGGQSPIKGSPDNCSKCDFNWVKK